MIINRVTFTGADDNTPVEKLQQLQKKYKFVEWGILISNNPGKPKQPSEYYIDSLQNKGLKLSLHICSDHASNILYRGNMNLVFDFFERYQLNFNFNHNEHDLNNYVKLTNKFKEKNFILQTNFSNENYIEKLLPILKNNNTNILYDSSGGRGMEIRQIKQPFDKIYTGYSGGINIDNIDSICKKIENTKNNDRVWIDIQTGARTDNKFDLDKVATILKIVDKNINKGVTF
jgi:hypothetical protein